MPGASAKRAKKDNKIHAEHNKSSEESHSIPKLSVRAYDGPGESSRGAPTSAGGASQGRGRQGSTAPPSVGQPSVRSPSRGPPTQPSIRSPSRTRAPSQVRGTSTNLLPDRTALMQAARYVDLPGNAYILGKEEYSGLQCINRAGFSTAGKEALVAINSHRVLKFPTQPIYQYDINIGNGVEKRGVIQAVWHSKTLQGKFPPGVLFDGNKLAWHMKDIGQEVRVMVDLDAERGQQSRDSNTFRVAIKQTARINLAQLQAYLDGQAPMDEAVISAITFLDHLLRETPSRNAINIRRSYFARLGADRSQLGQGVEAMKGVYQSMRVAQGKHMVVNVDVSNAVFWNEGTLLNAAKEVTGCGSYNELVQKSQPQRSGPNQPLRESNVMMALKKLSKNEILVKHNGRSQKEQEKVWKIKRIVPETARTKQFDIKDRATKKVIETTTVEKYYQKKYNLHLEFPNMPLVETTKKDVFYPMEVCYLMKGQRYPYKLNETQTAAMIKFAVTRPEGRKGAIAAGLQLLNWAGDRYLANYGVQIEPTMLKTKARVLDPPSILFGGNKKVEPKFAGRWDLRGQKFLIGNAAPLKSWGVCVFPGRGAPNQDQTKAFIASFINIYKGHGGNVVNTQPAMTLGNDSDPGASVAAAFQAAGNQSQARPQILIFVLPTKNTELYVRIKKSTDCRYGMMSQCVQAAHVLKNQPQYHSNVCMKFNAKLGGTTNKVALRGKAPMQGHFSKPTMIIGADVSHAAPGSLAPSFAAMTMSLDPYCSRYAAAVQTNGQRVEMIASQTIAGMMSPMFNHWSQNVGKGNLPQHVIYFRDGVSAAQYANLLKFEVASLKALLHQLSKSNPNYKVNFTVIVAEKRHHIRFFPEQGIARDKNGNPVPGTLVDRDVTEPFGYDFYLNSHSAIQGTARPTHYTVIMDEENMEPNALQTMIYEQVYQYMRATTPVSLHPAVYYAHLASNRARAHEDKSVADQAREASGGSSGEKPETEVKPLMEIHDSPDKAQFGMWYI